MVNRLGKTPVGRHGDARDIQRLNGKQLMDDGEHRGRGPGLGADTLGRIQPSTAGLVCLRGGRSGQTEHEKEHGQRQG